ncbi:MurR/RpiR family transcriptional regulator [Caviibacter abscessus]|uniref:MurR/RpiR family transcriptional regulator n=1 Tax=Caviibacter abscessus TaxID=1766719 RepID=UPI001E52AC5B|nr:MurR/RpiR family transcriptional regulator [Caviibacter abscessus]
MSILIKIRETKKFTENELCVAKYIMENYKNIKNISITDISSKTFTSISTVTRMCKKIGLSGFSELKIKLIEEIANLNSKNINVEKTDIDRTNDTKIIIEKLNKLSIDSLKETKLLQDAEIIDEVVNLINKKTIIDFYGMGSISYSLFRCTI